MRSLLRLTAMSSLIFAVAAPARADFLTENLTGFFGPTTTLGGVALGADTAFTLRATADTQSGFSFVPGLDIYAVTGLTLEIAGKGSFVGVPDSDTNIFLADKNLDPNYQLGLVNASISGGFGAIFLDATPAFDAAAPTSSTLSNFDGATFSGSYAIALVGVAGGLIVNDIGIEGQTASIQVSVPEPASLAMLGLGLLGATGFGWRIRKKVA